MRYQTKDASTPYRLRGTVQQTDTGLLYLSPSITAPQAGGTPQTRSTMRLTGLAVGYASAQNRSGETVVVGLAGRIPNRLWIAGLYDGAFTDDTTDAQDAGASDFALETTAQGSGFVIASRVPFGAVSINVGTASTGAPDRTVEYSNADGSGWTTLSNLFVQDGATNDNYDTGENLIAFAPPVDWGLTQTGGLNGVPAGYYAIRVTSSDAALTAGLATAIEIFEMRLLTESLADNNVWEYAGHPEMHFQNSEALAALFSVANAGNRITANVRMLS